MCKVGDIILVDSYKTNGKTMNQHSFIVLDDSNGKIRGLDFNMVGIVMSSFKDEKQRLNKMKYPGNFPVSFVDQNIIDGGNGKDGFTKTEQFYYFNKSKINFNVIGYLQEDVFELIILFIGKLKIPIEQIADNL